MRAFPAGPGSPNRPLYVTLRHLEAECLSLHARLEVGAARVGKKERMRAMLKDVDSTLHFP